MESIKSSIGLTSDILAALDLTTIITISDETGKIIHVNDNFCELSKYAREDLIGKLYQEVLHSGHHPEVFFKEMQATLEHGDIWKGEMKDKAKDGTYYWINTTIVPFLNKNREAYQYVSISKDITSRKRTEETLKVTLEKLAVSNKELLDIKHALDESSIVGMVDQDCSFIFVNENFCKISKYNQEELIGQHHRVLDSGYHSKDFFENLRKKVAFGQVWKGDIKSKAKDGSYYWVQTTIVPFLDEQGRPYQFAAIQNDITEQKNSEELLLRSEKLSVIGELAAGVAHEIRNPLTTIKGFLEFLKVDESDDKKKFYFNLLLEEVERINFIAGEFMLLAKPQAVHLSENKITPVIQKVIKFLESEFNLNNIVISLDYDNEDLMIKCEESQLKQVFINLIKNAIEAMPEGGNITISVKEKQEKVQIIFKDEGIGIPEVDIQKIGDPFYTTKENGNGLGLMVSFKIIQNHNGTIHIDSEENNGTTCTVTLPRIETNEK